MIKVTILGTGKVGTHLINACVNNSDILLVEVHSRSINHFKSYKNLYISNDLKALKPADLYIVALPDDVLTTIDLLSLNGLVIHTSGTKSLTVLKAKKRGVFYPAQSFSKEKKVNFKEIPLCLETEFKADFNLLEKFAKTIGEKVFNVSEEKRQKLHIAAVFANNFSNRVMGIAHDICRENQIDFKILQPLLQETFLKTQMMPPKLAQTGPAIRNDIKTIDKHLSELNGTTKEVYKILTKSIQEEHGIEL